jgi:hypothetical protein
MCKLWNEKAFFLRYNSSRVEVGETYFKTIKTFLLIMFIFLGCLVKKIQGREVKWFLIIYLYLNKR